MADIRPVFGFVIWLLYFLLFNFESNMAQMFIGMFIGAAFLYYIDKDKTFIIERKGNNRWASLGIAISSYFAFIVLSSLILSLFKVIDVFSLSSSVSVYSEYMASLMSQYSPALAGNVFFTWVSWGDLIPIVETFAFFLVLYEFLMDYVFRERADVSRIKTWMAMFAVAGIFTIFHITAKGFTNEPALLMTLIFGLISAYLVAWRKQVIEAVILHIITNSVSIIISLSVGASLFSPIIILIVTTTILYFLIRRVRIIR